MEVKLNEIQKELLKKAKEQGFLTTNDLATFYSSSLTIKSNIKRFILLGLLKENEDENKFSYIKQK